MIKNILRELGMTRNEVEIYLTLLNNGELSVNEVGMKSGLHRQVCYDALDRLLEKGFVSFITKNNKKFFKPVHPDRILDYLDHKKDDVTAILPKLTDMFKADREETEVEIIKGKNVLRTIYTDIMRVLLEKGGDLCAMGVQDSKALEFDEMALKQYIRKLKKSERKERLIAKESCKVFFEGGQSEYRLIPDKLFNPNPTHIYGNRIAIVVWGTPTYGIIIKNKQVADANRKYFEILWKNGKKRK
jgi:HTH-type transcriptional regulator, sugar sensing transcriptional regulator